MKHKSSIALLTIGHIANGALLGAICALAMALIERHGLRSAASPMLAGGTFIVIIASLSAWMAVGAGLSGFLLINAERGGSRGKVPLRMR